DSDIVRVKQRLGDELPSRPRLFASYWGDSSHARARRLAAAFDDERTSAIANGVLIDPIARRKRAAVLAYRHDAYVHVLDDLIVKVSARYWFERGHFDRSKKRIDRAALVASLTSLLPSVSVASEPDWSAGYTATVAT